MSSFRENRIKRQEQRAQRRRLGLNIASLVEAAKAVKKSDRWMDDANIDAASILEEFICQNKTKVSAETIDVGIDWDTILEWIEMLMPIIMLILSMFGI